MLGISQILENKKIKRYELVQNGNCHIIQISKKCTTMKYFFECE